MVRPAVFALLISFAVVAAACSSDGSDSTSDDASDRVEAGSDDDPASPDRDASESAGAGETRNGRSGFGDEQSEGENDDNDSPGSGGSKSGGGSSGNDSDRADSKKGSTDSEDNAQDADNKDDAQDDNKDDDDKDDDDDDEVTPPEPPKPPIDVLFAEKRYRCDPTCSIDVYTQSGGILSVLGHEAKDVSFSGGCGVTASGQTESYVDIPSNGPLGSIVCQVKVTVAASGEYATNSVSVVFRAVPLYTFDWHLAAVPASGSSVKPGSKILVTVSTSYTDDLEEWGTSALGVTASHLSPGALQVGDETYTFTVSSDVCPGGGTATLRATAVANGAWYSKSSGNGPLEWPIDCSSVPPVDDGGADDDDGGVDDGGADDDDGGVDDGGAGDDDGGADDGGADDQGSAPEPSPGTDESDSSP